MDKRLITVIFILATAACGIGTTNTDTATASAADSVILIGGQAYLMVRGAPFEPTALGGLRNRPMLSREMRTLDSVVVIGGQKALSTTTTISPSSTSSTPSSTQSIACKVEVHDETTPSTPPKHLFVISC